MAFPRTPVPAKLPLKEYDKLVKLLTVHYAYPLPYPLAGAYFEHIFAEATGGTREERKLLFDVLREGTGWSLKTLQWGNIAKGTQFDLVIQRCDILKDPSLSIQSRPDVLGARILQHFNRFGLQAAELQNVSDPRGGFLLRLASERDFVFFQQRYRLYQEDEVQWRWANEHKRSLMGYVGDQLVLRWYRSGTQLFGVYRIPDDAHEFRIDWRRASLEETIEFFSRQGIARADPEA